MAKSGEKWEEGVNAVIDLFECRRLTPNKNRAAWGHQSHFGRERASGDSDPLPGADPVQRCDGHLVATVDKDYCLLLYPLPDWEEIERKLMRLPSLDKRARRLQRLMVGHATEVDVDGHGRILLSRELREFAGLERQAVLLGPGQPVRTLG